MEFGEIRGEFLCSARIKVGFWANRQDFFNFYRILRFFLVFYGFFREMTRNDEKSQEITKNIKK